MTVQPISTLVSRYYIRLEVADKPGVLSEIARSFGDNGVSIASVIQKETDEAAQSAEIVIMTHGAREDSVRASLDTMNGFADVRQVGNVIRVEA